MRYLLCALLLFSFTGCASIQRFTSSDGLSNDERKVVRELQAKEDQEIGRQQNLALRIGTPRDRFVAVFGESDLIEFQSNVEILRYRIDDVPRLVEFTNGKLSAYRIDEAAKLASSHTNVRTVCQPGLFGKMTCETNKGTEQDN